MAGKTDQMFSFEIVSCLLAALGESGATVGNKHFSLMAKIDGSKTASGYEHMFRAAKNRAKEINKQIADGEIDAGTPAKSAGKAKSGAGTPASGGSKRKRGRKAAAETEMDDEEPSPSKKTKVKAEDKSDEDEV